MTLPLLSLVVFDLDGTLIDSRRDIADSANALLIECGAAPLTTEALANMVGEGARMLLERAFAAAGLGAVPDWALGRYLELYDERIDVHTRPYAGIPEMIAAVASQCTVSVLTNKPQRASEEVMRRLGLDTPPWQHVIGGDALLPRKPDPTALRWLIAQADATPASTLMVGDSRIDLETARNAGTHLCLCRYGFGFTQVDPASIRPTDLVVDTPAEISAACRATE